MPQRVNSQLRMQYICLFYFLSSSFAINAAAIKLLFKNARAAIMHF